MNFLDSMLETTTQISPHCTETVGQLIRTSTDDTTLVLQLGKGQILEERQGVQLIQDVQSQMFYVRNATEGNIVCATSDWSYACRSWLKVQKQAIAQHVAVSAAELHQTIEQYQDSPYFGRLIYTRDRQHSGLLQYGVQLDEYLAIQWSTIENHAVGQLQLAPVSWRRYRLSKWVEEQSPEDILKGLHASVEVFHQQWVYDMFRFNSEHWARLMTLGECACHQTYEPATHDESDSAIMLEHNWDAQIALGIAIAL
jgi:hypothetical protein